jgi:thiamine pyrophosphokinase
MPPAAPPPTRPLPAPAGDLDSVRPEVRQFYVSQGVPVVDLSHDQDTTDLTKCVKYTEGLLGEQRQARQQDQQHQQQAGGEPAAAAAAAAAADGEAGAGPGSEAGADGRRRAGYAIVALGALGGRLDHTLGNINTLHMFPHLNLLLMGDGNLARLLPAGRSVVRPDRRREGPTCGLVPLVRGPGRPLLLRCCGCCGSGRGRPPQPLPAAVVPAPAPG